MWANINLLWLLPLFLHENPFREQNTGTLISISVNEIGPNVVSEHINLRMVECTFCCMQLFIYPVALRS